MGGRQGNTRGNHRLRGGRHRSVPVRMRHGKQHHVAGNKGPKINCFCVYPKRCLKLFLQASFQSCKEVYNALKATIAELIRKPTLVVRNKQWS